jgi:lipopolysaccharide export system permease protein
VKQYYTYIIRGLARYFLYVLATTTIIIWLSQMLRYLSLVSNSSVSIWQFFSTTLLLLPSLCLVTIPIAIFIAIKHLYLKLINDSELLALQAAGLSKKQLAKPAITLALFATIISCSISWHIMPISYKAFKHRINEYRNSYTQTIIEPGVFNNSMKTVTVYVEELIEDKSSNGRAIAANNIFRNILIHDSTIPDRPVTLIAEQGKIIKDNQRSGIELSGIELIKGAQQHIDKDGNLAVLYFDRFIYYISTGKTDNVKVKFDPNLHTIPSLLKHAKQNKERTNMIMAEVHQRISWPIQAFILGLFAIMTTLPNHIERMQNSNHRELFHYVGAFSIIGVHLAINNLIARFPSINFLLYAYILIILAIMLSMLYSVEKQYNIVRSSP